MSRAQATLALLASGVLLGMGLYLALTLDQFWRVQQRLRLRRAARRARARARGGMLDGRRRP